MRASRQAVHYRSATPASAREVFVHCEPPTANKTLISTLPQRQHCSWPVYRRQLSDSQTVRLPSAIVHCATTMHAPCVEYTRRTTLRTARRASDLTCTYVYTRGMHATRTYAHAYTWGASSTRVQLSCKSRHHYRARTVVGTFHARVQSAMQVVPLPQEIRGGEPSQRSF